MLWYFKLVKNGYGSLQEVMELDAETVLQAIAYENFVSDYQSAYIELNKEST